MADFLWISNGDFLHYWLVISLTLIVIDFFINTEVLSWVAMAIFATWATALMDVPAVWSVLVFIIFFVIAALFYVFVFKALTRSLTAYATRNAPAELNDTLKGKSGIVCGEGENLGVTVDGVIYPVADESRPGLTAGDTVKVEVIKDGMAFVTK